jgi:hypothetical protein
MEKKKIKCVEGRQQAQEKKLEKRRDEEIDLSINPCQRSR